MLNVRHFKLATDEEIICQIVTYPEPESEDTEVVIRNALKLMSVVSPDGNVFHTLRPWMIYQVSENNMVSLNINLIVGEALPHQDIINNYEGMLKKFLEDIPESEHEINFDDSDEISIEDLLDAQCAKLNNKIH